MRIVVLGDTATSGLESVAHWSTKVLGQSVIASSPGEFRDALASEIKRWAKVVKDANIKPQG
ncbi:MAG TPA: hypothetical protein VFK15_04000 [Burkholderiales bacterium]|nr:hypothetical protein [Burkholderiales bacterium]